MEEDTGGQDNLNNQSSDNVISEGPPEDPLAPPDDNDNKDEGDDKYGNSEDLQDQDDLLEDPEQEGPDKQPRTQNSKDITKMIICFCNLFQCVANTSCVFFGVQQ